MKTTLMNTFVFDFTDAQTRVAPNAPRPKPQLRPLMRNIGTVILLMLLGVVTPPRLEAQTTETYTFTTNRLVPDGNPSGLSDARTLNSAIGTIASVTVHLNIAGNFNGDLYGYLVHSSGFTVLLNRPGKTASNSAGYADSGLNVTFQTGATNGDIHLYQNVTLPAAGSPLTGTWQPDGRDVDPTNVTDVSPRTTSLTNFIGLNAAGEWTLYLADLQSGGTNELTEWSMTIVGESFPTLTWANPSNIVYGTALGASQLNATATFDSTNVPGTFTYTPAVGTVLEAGLGQTLSVTFTPSNATTFLPISTNVTINVTAAPLTIMASNASKVYGAALPTFTASYSGFVNGDTAASLTTPVTLGTIATASSPVGAYAITATGAIDANYTITEVNGSLNITAAPLNITASPQNKTYGQTVVFGSGSALFTSSGLQNGETIGSVTLAVSGNGGAATALVSGSPYTITPSAATGGTFTAGNYTITYATGNLTVNKAALSITADAQTKTYGQTVAFASGSALFTSSGLQNGETIGSVTLAVSGNGGAATALVSGSPYTITPSAATGGTFTAGNYTISYLPGSLTITQSATTGLIVSSANPALPGANVTFTMTVSPVAPGAGTPGGQVNFRIDGIIAGSGALSGGVATFATTTLTHGSNTVAAEYAGNLNFVGITNILAPAQIIDTPPVATNVTIERYPTMSVKVSFATLLASTSGAEGDTLTIIVSSTSSNGAAITVTNGWVFYTPASGFTNADSFTYTVTDNFGESAVGAVFVVIEVDNSQGENLTITNLGNGSYLIVGNGIPGRTYRLQSTPSLSPADWQILVGGSVTAGGTGSFQYTNTPSGGTNFYRTVFP
jgi:subtilisin-like proprotein convertase family protein